MCFASFPPRSSGKARDCLDLRLIIRWGFWSSQGQAKKYPTRMELSLELLGRSVEFTQVAKQMVSLPKKRCHHQ